MSLVGVGPARAQSIAPTSAMLGDPSRCVVVVEDMGDVGFRISDAQAVTEALMTALKKRVGPKAAMYAGVLRSTEKLQKMLGNSIEGASPQQEQIAHYRACAEASPWRVKAKFGAPKKGGKHWIEATCRKKDSETAVDTLRVEGASFVLARDALREKVDTFCMQIPDISAIPFEPPPGQKPAGPPGMSKPKEIKPWTPPPRRD